MKICAAQTRPLKGDIESNIARHKTFIDLAVANGAGIIIFPELSITGYEPELAKDLATDASDRRFDDFQQISNAKQVTIGIGAPTKHNGGVRISMIIFQPQQARLTYSKQYLHEDELPYFIKGDQQVFLSANDHKMAPAICYESLVPAHAAYANGCGAKIYLASVAKSAGGVEKAYKHYPRIAGEYSMTVLMANCVGPCDNFESVGKTSAWNNKGMLAGQLNDTNEGILVFDTDTGKATELLL
ncbi:MAG TPA: carbon-nitrogen hydrolase family protein [Chitinophagaceae bacterium]